MKETFLFFIFCFCFILVDAQVETYSNYSFNGDTYNAFVVKIDSETIKKFNIIQNDSIFPHQLFLNNVLSFTPACFLINACISDTTCKPIGYYVKNSQQMKPPNLQDGNGNFYLKPNGALLFTQDDVVLCESSQISNYQNVRLGIQSGPMLLINGAVNPQFSSTSKNKNLRCGVGVYSNIKNEKFIVFCISNNPVSFYDFSVFFNKKFKCNNALCLESVGCAMYFPNQVTPNESFNGYICNYLYFKI